MLTETQVLVEMSKVIGTLKREHNLVVVDSEPLKAIKTLCQEGVKSEDIVNIIVDSKRKLSELKAA